MLANIPLVLTASVRKIPPDPPFSKGGTIIKGGKRTGNIRDYLSSLAPPVSV
jgi:hypothetical protein